MNDFILIVSEKDGVFSTSAGELPDHVKTKAEVKQFFISSGVKVEFIGPSGKFIRQYKVYIADKLAMYTNLDNKDRRAIHLSDDLLKNEDEVRKYITETEALRGFEADVIFSKPE